MNDCLAGFIANLYSKFVSNDTNIIRSGADQLEANSLGYSLRFNADVPLFGKANGAGIKQNTILSATINRLVVNDWGQTKD